MAEQEDPRVSDENTGLPPLDQVDPDDTLLVCAWVGGTGVAMTPGSDETIPVRYLSVRGLTRGTPGDPHSAEWAQFHLAVPVEHAVDVAAALASGGMLDGG